MKFRNIYTAREEERVGTLNYAPSLTVQADADDCDINNIMDKYVRYGTLPNVETREPIYADATTLPCDYLEALTIVNNAQDAFNSLPSNVRKEFNNNPSELLEFINDSNNYEKAIELGLIPKPEAPAEPIIVNNASAEISE